MTGRVKTRLEKLGLVLPEAPVPAANYVPWAISGNQLFIAGQLPMVDGKVGFVGQVGEDLPLKEGVEASAVTHQRKITTLVASLAHAADGHGGRADDAA